MNHKSSHIYENALKLSLQPVDNSLVKLSLQSKHQPQFYKNSNKIAVIVDPRYDDIMEAVIKNFMYYMGPKEWNLLIISSEKYEAQIRETFPYALFLKIDEKLIYYSNNQPNINISTYNNIFLSQQFWNSIPVEHIAIFQKDCVMFNMFNE